MSKNWEKRQIASREAAGEKGWKSGPRFGSEKVGFVSPRKFRQMCAAETAEELARGSEYDGEVTLRPFSARRMRSKRWYTRWSLRAKHLLKNKKHIRLQFPGTNLEDLMPVFEVLQNLPYRVHAAFAGKRWISTRKHDRKAKELLDMTHGDMWGKYGAIQALLAYWRAFKNMKRKTGSSRITANTKLVLSMKTRKRRRRKPKAKPITTINSTKELYEHNAKQDRLDAMDAGDINYERSGRNGNRSRR